MRIAISLVAGLLTALSASATTHVDFNPLPSGTNAAASPRIKDVDINGSDVWNFSDTDVLLSSPFAQNNVIYGGLTTTWTGGASYNPTFQLQSTVGTQLQIASGNGDIAVTGAYIWNQADFLNGGDALTVSLGAGSTITIGLNATASNTRDYRAVVNQGGTYYVSETGFTDNTAGAHVVDLFTTQWALLNTADYTYGAFAPLTLDDVEGVGILFNYTRTGDLISRIQFNDFQFNAEPVPEPTTFGLICIGSVALLFARRKQA